MGNSGSPGEKLPRSGWGGRRGGGGRNGPAPPGGKKPTGAGPTNGEESIVKKATWVLRINFDLFYFSEDNFEIKINRAANGYLSGGDAGMDACRVYRLGTVKIENRVAMESLAYENATPLEVGPPPLRGDVWVLGQKYSLPTGTLRHLLPLTSAVDKPRVVRGIKASWLGCLFSNASAFIASMQYVVKMHFQRSSEKLLLRNSCVCTEKAELLRDVKSRLWFSYRKNFKAISEPTQHI